MVPTSCGGCIVSSLGPISQESGVRSQEFTGTLVYQTPGSRLPTLD
jgi:hypothetical protein